MYCTALLHLATVGFNVLTQKLELIYVNTIFKVAYAWHILENILTNATHIECDDS